MELININHYHHPLAATIQNLYENSFEANLRKDFERVFSDSAQGNCQLLAMVNDNQELLGFTEMIHSDSLMVIEYLVTEPKFRSLGIGSAILQQLKVSYPNHHLLVEVESTRIGNPKDEDVRRKKFYARNNFNDLGLSVNFFGSPLDLMGTADSLSHDQYFEPYFHVYGKDIDQHIYFIDECDG